MVDFAVILLIEYLWTCFILHSFLAYLLCFYVLLFSFYGYYSINICCCCCATLKTVL